MPGTLYIVSTPIGNLEDMTVRAVRVLKEVGVIAAEDTRHTKQLCTHFGIHTSLTSYQDLNKEEKTAVLLERLQAGTDVALVSDAGTPVVSDPGFSLITRAIEAGIRAVLARELTKHYEECHRGTLEELIALVRSRPPKGEITLVVEGAAKRRRSEPGKDTGQDHEREED